MRKRFLILCLMFLTCALLVSCSNNEAANNDTGSTEPKIIYEEPLQESPEPQGNAGTDDDAGPDSPDVQSSPDAGDTVDVDLSGVGDMLVYAQVVRILETPEEYLGDTMKLRGFYYPIFFESTEQYHHLIIVGDESLCCQAAIEFMWNGEHTFPDDYPDENAEIEIVGVFASYEMLDRTYYYLIVDGILKNRS